MGVSSPTRTRPPDDASPAYEDEKWVSVRSIGRGLSGHVYEGQGKSLAQKVAIKIFEPHPSVTDDEVRKYLGRKFIEEAEALSALAREIHVVKVFDLNRSYPAIVMEFVEANLAEVLQLDKDRHCSLSYASGVPVEEALRLGCEISEALWAVHGIRKIHRDVKPQNILLTKSNLKEARVKLADFGILGDQTAPNRSLIGGRPFQGGSLGYAPHEQYLGDANIGPWTDLFALGVVLYLLLTGHHPWGESACQRWDVILGSATPHDEAPLRRDRIAKWPGLRELISALLRHDCEGRPQSAYEVGQALQKIRDKRPQWGKREALAGLLVGAGLLGAGGAVAVWWRGVPDTSHQPPQRPAFVQPAPPLTPASGKDSASTQSSGLPEKRPAPNPILASNGGAKSSGPARHERFYGAGRIIKSTSRKPTTHIGLAEFQHPITERQGEGPVDKPSPPKSTPLGNQAIIAAPPPKPCEDDQVREHRAKIQAFIGKAERILAVGNPPDYCAAIDELRSARGEFPKAKKERPEAIDEAADQCMKQDADLVESEVKSALGKYRTYLGQKIDGATGRRPIDRDEMEEAKNAIDRANKCTTALAPEWSAWLGEQEGKLKREARTTAR